MAPTDPDKGSKRKKPDETVEKNESGKKRSKRDTDYDNELIQNKDDHNEFHIILDKVVSPPVSPQPAFPPKGLDPTTPSTSSQLISYIEQWPSSGKQPIGSAEVSCQGEGTVKRSIDWSESNGDMTIHVGLEMNDGEYVLKLSNVATSTKIERAKKLAHSGAVLLFQGEMLRNLGQQLLSQFQGSFQSTLKKSAPASHTE